MSVEMNFRLGAKGLGDARAKGRGKGSKLNEILVPERRRRRRRLGR